MIGAYLTDDVTVVRSGGRDQWGTPLPAIESAQKGRVEYGTKLVRNERGEQVVSSARVWLEMQTLTHEDHIRFDGVEHAILAIERRKDFSALGLKVAVA